MLPSTSYLKTHVVIPTLHFTSFIKLSSNSCEPFQEAYNNHRASQISPNVVQKVDISTQKLKLQMIDSYANQQIGCLEIKWRTDLKTVTYSILIERFKEKYGKKIKKSSTKHKQLAQKVWRFGGLRQRKRASKDQNIENYELEALNKILKDFCATVREKASKTISSLTVFALQIDRYLRRQSYKYSIIKDRE